MTWFRARAALARRPSVTATAIAVAVCVVAAVLVLVLWPKGSSSRGWAYPNADLAGTRAAAGSSIDAANVASLRPAWRFALTGYQTPSGVFASTPIASGGRVYLQDLNSDVFALDSRTGRVVWKTHARQTSGGPNGLSAAGGRIYGNTSHGTFALDATTGKVLWRSKLVFSDNQAIDIAPVAANGFVYTSTVGLTPGGKGVLYALDAATGAI